MASGEGVAYRSVPGIKVTVYLPPNLVGLKMSELTVAMAKEGSETRSTTQGPEQAGKRTYIVRPLKAQQRIVELARRPAGGSG